MTRFRSDLRFFLPLASFVLAAGCASGAAGNGEVAPRTDRNVLVQDEIRASHAADLFGVIQERRSQWLRSRGGSETVRVYFGTTRMGGPDALRGVSPAQVYRVEYLDAASATQRLGPGHTQGAIIVEFTG